MDFQRFIRISFFLLCVGLFHQIGFASPRGGSMSNDTTESESTPLLVRSISEESDDSDDSISQPGRASLCQKITQCLVQKTSQCGARAGQYLRRLWDKKQGCSIILISTGINIYWMSSSIAQAESIEQWNHSLAHVSSEDSAELENIFRMHDASRGFSSFPDLVTVLNGASAVTKLVGLFQFMKNPYDLTTSITQNENGTGKAAFFSLMLDGTGIALTSIVNLVLLQNRTAYSNPMNPEVMHRLSEALWKAVPSQVAATVSGVIYGGALARNCQSSEPLSPEEDDLEQ